MEIRNREVEVLDLICPKCQVVLKPVAEVKDCTLWDADGLTPVNVAIMRCPRCGGGCGMAFQEKEGS